MKTFLKRLSPVLSLVVLTGFVTAPAFGDEPKPKKTLGTIERIDPKFDELVPKDAAVEIIADGFEWCEGPVWFPEDGGYLLFSDTMVNTVFRWDEKNGLKPFLKPSGYTGTTPRGGEPGSNGLARDPNGMLVLMQHGDRRVARLEKDGSFTTLVDKYNGKRLNSPNDGVYDSKGNLFFTDPPYGLEKSVDDPKRELDFQGVYRYSKDGKLTLLTKELTRPNGIAFSPDEKTLYVANSDPEHAVWMSYPMKDDGTNGPGKVFFDATKWVKEGKKGLPDGLKVDAHGNLFAAGPGGIQVFSPDGTHLGTFNTGEADGNVAWGNDGSTLYIMADMFVGRVKLKTKGNGF
jgi:gluconolactonase